MKPQRLFMILAIAGGMAACSNSDDVTDENNLNVQSPNQNPGGETLSDSAFRLNTAQMERVAPLNEFSVKLFRQLSSGQVSTVVSPLSVAFVLGMINDGAQNQTQQEILTALGFGSDNAKTVDELMKKFIEGAPKADPKVTVALANNVTLNKDYHLNPTYVQVMKEYYEASTYSLDFSKPEALQTINGWCNEKTRGLIPSIIAELRPNAVAYLLNAIYFKGEWKYKFDKNMSYGEGFQTTDGFKDIVMMHKTAKALYAEKEGLKALRLPIGDGRYSMTFLLPSTVDGLDNMKTQLTGKSIQSLAFTEQEVEMALPVFTTQADIDLIPLMQALGVKRMFSHDAELWGIAQQDGKNASLFVSLMKQKTRLGVDEQGTEGAAVTIAELLETSDLPDEQPKTTTFYATHPFVYAITEQATGALFFMGQFCGE